ncbi:unnamed protein product [Dovyalis caffra]|uniref:Uncharacterized protein n=1 Tax=Dovyalis caffra TaxID=77055 RepID=A0AAV1SKQ8_9ROSI|nr:unnamed protein product [Dovyalis caffra]
MRLDSQSLWFLGRSACPHHHRLCCYGSLYSHDRSPRGQFWIRLASINFSLYLVREEVLRECRMGIPEADVLTKLKEVNMVLLETLRLYGAVDMDREAAKDMKLGNLMIPKGVCVTIQFVKIHRSKDFKVQLEDESETRHLASHPDLNLPKNFGNSAMFNESIAVAKFQGRPLADHKSVKNGRPPGALLQPRPPLDAPTVAEAIT